MQKAKQPIAVIKIEKIFSFKKNEKQTGKFRSENLSACRTKKNVLKKDKQKQK